MDRGKNQGTANQRQARETQAENGKGNQYLFVLFVSWTVSIEMFGRRDIRNCCFDILKDLHMLEIGHPLLSWFADNCQQNEH